MDRRTFLRRSFLAAIGLALVPELVVQEEDPPEPATTSWREDEPVWSRIEEGPGRKDAFYAYGSTYHQMMVKRPANAYRLVVV